MVNLTNKLRKIGTVFTKEIALYNLELGELNLMCRTNEIIISRTHYEVIGHEKDSYGVPYEIIREIESGSVIRKTTCGSGKGGIKG